MRRAIVVAALCVVTVFILTACKASTTNKATADSGDSPDEQVVVLLDQGKIDDASDVVVRQESFFASSIGDPEIKQTLDRLAAALEYKYSPEAQNVLDRAENVSWPTARSNWSAVKSELAALDAKLGTLKRIAIFKYPQYRPQVYDRAVKGLKAKQAAIRADAAREFAAYPLDGGQDFFAAYPVSLGATSFLEQNETVWSGALKRMSPESKDAFLSSYGQYLPDTAQAAMAEQYFLSLCPNPKKASLKEIFEAYEKTTAAGMELDSIPGVKIAFLQVTSPNLIKDKALDFGINIKLDMPFDASKASMRKAFNHDAVKEADVLVLVNVAVSKAKRVAARNETIQSTYVESYIEKENPEYEIVKAELEAASDEFRSAKNRQTTPWIISLTAHLIDESEKEDRIEEASKDLESLKEKLRTTPKYVRVANYQPYPVTKAHMDIYKYATVNYYIVDKRDKTLFRDTFDVQEKSFFTVCYAMEQSDPNREKFLQESVLEEDVVRYELEPAVVNLSDLMDQFSQRPNEWKRYANMGDVHRTFTRDRSKAQLARKNETYGYDKYADKRFDSVVLVRNTGAGIGTGFYVTDEMVLTNYHVVEESNYVQLKLFNEREIMGRVIAKDAHLDLALIQADVRGKPVCFFNKRELPLGETLEIIGHPDGFEFSVTRGVISSIRKTPPINYRESNKDVLYIQSDASTNGGNSGGPVFYGNYVVGVTDWGRVLTRSGAPAQGLNFSIHYSEVFKFFDHNGINVCKGSK